MKTLVVSFFAVCSVVMGQVQTPVTPASVADPLPDYVVGFGYGVSPSSSLGGFASNQEAWAQGEVKVAAKLYATTTIDFTPTANVMRAGGAYQIASGLKFRVDGGLALGTVAIGSFSGGLIYERPISKSGLSFTTELRITTNPAGPAGAVNVGIYCGLSKGFFKQ